jgi:hypothetical protein
MYNNQQSVETALYAKGSPSPNMNLYNRDSPSPYRLLAPKGSIS